MYGRSRTALMMSASHTSPRNDVVVPGVTRLLTVFGDDEVLATAILLRDCVRASSLDGMRITATISSPRLASCGISHRLVTANQPRRSDVLIAHWCALVESAVVRPPMHPDVPPGHRPARLTLSTSTMS